MSEKLPQAYQPPPSAPADASEPSLVPPDDPTPVPDDPAPVAPRRRSRTGLLVAFGLVLLAGAVVWAIARPAPERAPRSTSAPAAAAPAAATTPVQRLDALPGSAERTRRWRFTEGAPTSIYFANDTDQKVTVHRLAGDEERIRYAEIEPGHGYHQDTYAGHIWVIAGPGGEAVAVFQAEETPGLAEIE
ncbi:hypothetical protein Q0Z83_016860 [Actinoplanes sichuanensis]|uniref:von Hippel-Lindau disease tumor suppressor protein n=1 Tax=Actinoplanes sichuanensis TaxID=512349 RepID=A0ABW4A8V0_9ACTN|nr:hypothetical protein [Actinoplanes sichuanensis]BEL03495.1 hypothetical protein Q0Z83_016860 [Actinoplanes sichuanensis]